jgi:ABC-2 type transport system permease protein
MNKLWRVAWKDLYTVFRDPALLVMMLLTPFALTLAIAFAFGGLGGGSGSGLSNIPVVIVNHDQGELGEFLKETFTQDGLKTLITPTFLQNDTEARALVDQDRSAVAIIVPADLTERIHWASTAGQQPSVIEVYANPTRPNSANVARGVLDRFLSALGAGLAAGEVTAQQLLQSGLISPSELPALIERVSQAGAEQSAKTQLIVIRSENVTPQNKGFDWLTYMAPSMAIMFLMFTVTGGARSILIERDLGTLPRLLTTPTSAAQVLGGKVFGTYLTGLAQVLILVAASSLLFKVRWGSLPAVLLFTLALVAAATAWGMLIAAYVRRPSEANAIGTALALTFGGLAGNFVPRQLLPSWLRTASYISPNAWGLEGYTLLSSGGKLADVAGPIAALLAMAIILFVLAIIAFRRQYR